MARIAKALTLSFHSHAGLISTEVTRTNTRTHAEFTFPHYYGPLTNSTKRRLMYLIQHDY